MINSLNHCCLTPSAINLEMTHHLQMFHLFYSVSFDLLNSRLDQMYPQFAMCVIHIVCIIYSV